MPAFSIADKPFFELRDVFGDRGQGRYGATMRAYTLGELKWARSQPALKDGGYIGWDHTAGYLVPIQTHIESHPEYYPTLRGATIAASTPTMKVGLCACRAGLEASTIKNALAWMDHQPDRRLLALPMAIRLEVAARRVQPRTQFPTTIRIATFAGSIRWPAPYAIRIPTIVCLPWPISIP
jgi:hypothetical protein